MRWLLRWLCRHHELEPVFFGAEVCRRCGKIVRPQIPALLVKSPSVSSESISSG
jgi:hypothetical protein